MLIVEGCNCDMINNYGEEKCGRYKFILFGVLDIEKLVYWKLFRCLCDFDLYDLISFYFDKRL